MPDRYENYALQRSRLERIPDASKRLAAINRLNEKFGHPLEEEVESVSVVPGIPEHVKRNCVYYARWRVPELPMGLMLRIDKERIMNSTKPVAGAVAVIDSGNAWAHVAVVEEVMGKRVRISESNWGVEEVTERAGLPEQLRILGYFVPPDAVEGVLA